MPGQFLIIRLEGPMMSFGTVAVDGNRPSGDLPGLSMLTGLMARALGWSRPEHNPLSQRLQERISYAARSERTSRHGNAPLHDYHTAQLNADDAAWTTHGRPETRGGSPATHIPPNPRHLDYRTDLRVTAAVTLRDPAEFPTLQDLAQALIRPASVLFIGRKSCLPSEPIFQELTTADNLLDALHRIPSASPDEQDPVLWDGDAAHPSTSLLRTIMVQDLRDWANDIHTGRRTVFTGLMAKPAAGETP